MKKRFVLTVEYPDDFGPTWLKKDKVLQFLQEYFRGRWDAVERVITSKAAVFDVTVEDLDFSKGSRRQ